nr:PAS domain S-box protein [uncultured Draconibacterium sp.]
MESTKNQAFLNNLLNSISESVIATNLKGEIIFWNKAAEELYLWKKQEVSGKNIVDITPTKATVEQANEIMQLISNGESWEGEFDVQDKNGRKFTAKVKNSPLCNDNGELVGIIGISRDVSEEVELVQSLKNERLKSEKTEEKQKQSEEKYRALYENAPISYQSLDIDGNFIDVNPTWLSTLGYKRGEVIGRNYEDFLHPEWKSHFRKNFPAFKKRGYVSDVHFKIKHKKGHYIDISFEGCIGTHPDGSFRQTYCVFKDMTEQKAIEDSLIRNQFYLSKAQEIGKIGTWELDIPNNKLYWTKENYNVFGVKAGTSLTYETFLSTIHPDDVEYVDKEWNDALKGKSYDIEHRIVANGKTKWVREKAEIKFNQKGEAVSAIGFSQDITKLKDSEQKLYASENLYRNLFENIIDEVHYWKVIRDEDGKIKTWKLVDANKSALRAWNKTKDQVIGKTTHDIFNYDAETLFMPVVKRIFKTGNPYRWEKFFPATNQYLSMDSIPLGDYFISTGRDISDIKKRELELQIAKEQANSNLQQIEVIQANSPNIIWKWDIDNEENFKNSYISEAADDFLALPKGSIGNSMPKFLSYILPEYLPLINDAIKNACDHPKKLISLEYEVKRADGNLAWFSSSGKVIPENGKLTIYGSTIDISEKKRQESELIKAKEKAEENAQKLKLSDRVFNLTIDMFCIAGFDGYFKYLNPAWERTLGWSIKELLSKPWLDFVHPDDIEKTENVKSVLVDGNEIYQFENRYICKDGSEKWLSWNSQSFPKENVMVGAVRDITESIKVQEKLNKNQYYLSKAQEIGKIGTWELDIPNNKLYWTKENYNVFGVKAGTILTYETFLSTIHPDDVEYVDKQWNDAMKGKPYDIEHRVIANGKTKWVREKADLKFDKNGKAISAIGFTQEITKFKKAELRLKESQEGLNLQ